MNYYDLSNPAVLTSKGYKKGLLQKKAAILYKFTVFLFSILTVALFLLSTRRSDYSSSLLKYCLFGFYAVNKESNQVISADKTNWGGISSNAYKEATGED